MIITDKFILLNLPKTGSTFARTVVKKLYGYEKRTPENKYLRTVYPFFQRRILATGILGFRELQTLSFLQTKRLFGLFPWPHRNPHRRWADAPERFRDLPVAVIVRDPMELAMSHYLYGFFTQNVQSVDGVPIHRLYPNFPDIQFGEFLDLLNRIAAYRLKKTKIEPHIPVGYLSLQFIRLVFRNPDRALKNMSSSYLDNCEYRSEMPDQLYLLKNENLKNDLVSFLNDMGFSESDTDFIRHHPKVNETQHPLPREHGNRETFFTESLTKSFLIDEHPFYSILSQSGINYESNNF